MAGCLPEAVPAPALRLSRFRQDGDRNVFLNEPLVFDFSADLDPLSVTESRDGESGSFRVLDPNGVPVKGTLTVSPRQLVFRASLPLLPDLTDGGFRPGTEYSVELVGFPRPDGLRSPRSGPLERTAHLGFRTALAGGPKPLFDPFFELGGGEARMRLMDSRLAPSDNLTLQSNYAIDPRSLSSAEFVLTHWDDLDGGRPGRGTRLHPRLLENDAQQARLELIPERALRLGRYFLTRRRGERRLVSLGGNPLRMRVPVQGLQIELALPAVGSQVIRFPRSQGGRQDEALGSAGSLHRDAQEAFAGVRLLAASGTGRQGELLEPGTWSEGSDWHASRVHLGPGSLLDLSGRDGCVVLRSQAALTLEGNLERRLKQDVNWSDSTPFRGEQNDEILSVWLRRMIQLGEPWTVLVAGGDLRISGEIQVDGPLMLVAGGVIRVYGGGLVRGQVIYKSPEGGDNIGHVNNAPLRLDTPGHNPLVSPQVYGLMTRPFRPEGGVRAWLGAEVDASLGSARLDLQFVGLRDKAGGGVGEVGPVASIEQLLDCQGIRLLLLLSVPAGEEAAAPGPGKPWSPPFVRSVTLRWARAR